MFDLNFRALFQNESFLNDELNRCIEQCSTVFCNKNFRIIDLYLNLVLKTTKLITTILIQI